MRLSVWNSQSIVLGLASKWKICFLILRIPPLRQNHFFQTHFLLFSFFSVNIPLILDYRSPITSSASIFIPARTDLCVDGREKRVFCWCSFYPVLVLYLRSLCSGCSLLLTVSIMLYDFMPSWTFTILSIWAFTHSHTCHFTPTNRSSYTYANSHTIYKSNLTWLFVFIILTELYILNLY